MQTFLLAFTKHPPHYYTHSSKIFTRRPPKSRHTVYKNTTNAQLHKVEALDPEKCSHSHYLKIDRWGRQQTIIPKARGGQQRKKKKNRRLKKQMSDVIKAKWQALCEKDWRVYSYLLLPGFQYQHHRTHMFPFPPTDSQREAQTSISI